MSYQLEFVPDMSETLRETQPPLKLWPLGQIGVMSKEDREQLPETPLNAGDLVPGSKYLVKKYGPPVKKFVIHYHGQNPDNPDRIQFSRLDEAGKPVFDLYLFAKEPSKYGQEYCEADLKTLGLTPLENGQFSSVSVTPHQAA